MYCVGEIGWVFIRGRQERAIASYYLHSFFRSRFALPSPEADTYYPYME
jgi:hypothetical protein